MEIGLNIIWGQRGFAEASENALTYRLSTKALVIATTTLPLVFFECNWI